MSRRRAAGRALRAAGAAGLALATGCTGVPDADPRYRPTESVLEVVAVLQRHVPDDTYRFEPARDFTGRNVYRASLLRLENLEKVHADALRAGHMRDVVHFAKGRALERLRAYSLAAEAYRRAAEVEGPLRREAREGAALCDALAEAAAIGPGGVPAELPEAEAPEEGTEGGASRGGDASAPAAVAADAPESGAEPAPAEAPGSREAVLEALDRRGALLEALLAEVGKSHYRAIVRKEIERADLARARFLADVRRLSPDGDVRALAAMQRLVASHRESKNASAHLLRLADLYRELAEEYVAEHPPEGLRFDPPRFEELVESAARLYEAVANQDGAPEKLEAARRLESFIAFTLRVDRDRFRPEDS